jgi:signal peptidase I
MILIVLVTFLLGLVLINPAILLLGGTVFHIEGIDFKRAFITNIAMVGLSLLLLLGWGSGLISIPIFLAVYVLVGIWIVKKLFKTTIPRALGVFVFAAVLSSIFSSFVSAVGFKSYSIPTNSMAPALIQGDYVFVNKIVYRINEPERGDLMVFRVKNEKHQLFMKRLIGLPGEEIEIREGKVYIDKALIKETLVVKGTAADGDTAPLENYGPVKIPGKSFFVLGDNTKYTYDSRHFGFVSRSDVIGRIDTIYWSLDRETNRIRWKRILKRANPRRGA